MLDATNLSGRLMLTLHGRFNTSRERFSITPRGGGKGGRSGASVIGFSCRAFNCLDH